MALMYNSYLNVRGLKMFLYDTECKYFAVGLCLWKSWEYQRIFKFKIVVEKSGYVCNV